MKITQMFYAALLVGIGAVGCVGRLRVADFGEHSPYWRTAVTA